MAGTVIRGTVTRRDGAPIVEARAYFTQAPVPIPDVATLTNEEGNFSLHAPAPGTYRIELTAEGFLQSSVSIEVVGTEPETELTVELEASSD